MLLYVSHQAFHHRKDLSSPKAAGGSSQIGLNKYRCSFVKERRIRKRDFFALFTIIVGKNTRTSITSVKVLWEKVERFGD